MPGLIIYVWLGSLAADVTEAVAGGGMSTPPAGALGAVLVLAICGRAAAVCGLLQTVFVSLMLDEA